MKPTPPVLPGSRPVVGHTLEFMKDRQSLLQKGFKTLGSIFALRLANRWTAVLIDPDYHQTFFLETDKKLSMHKSYRFLKAAFGEVAFAGPPEMYTKHRPVLHKPFKSEKVPATIRIMQLEVQQWLDSLGEQGEIELTGEITALVQNVAAHALMGQDFRDHAGPDFWKLYLTISRSLDPILPPNLPLPKFIRREQARRKLREMLKPIIAERRVHPDRYDDFLQDFVNSRYKDGSPVEDETILAMLLGLMFAGHETTAGQAAWTIIQLLQNPNYLKLVQQEIAENLPPGCPIDARVLSSLKHVSWAVLETTRMRPSADMLMRRAEEDIEIGEYRIPRGWNLLVVPALAQRLPDVFAEPEQYDPLRFAPDRTEDRKHRFNIIDFGGGIHKCAGMNFANNEMTVITSLLFQQFDLELVTPDPHVTYGMGASRPEKTIICYRRKPRSVEVHAAARPTSAAVEGRPYHQPVQQ